MNAVTETLDPILFSDSAASKVAQLIEEEGNPDLKLRIRAGRGMFRFPVRFYL
jgi:iron-sulfur cluster insertion protein